MRLTLTLRLAKTIREEITEFKKFKFANIKTIDALLWLYKERSLTLSGFRKYLDQKREESIADVNKFYDMDFSKLGAELHAATYALKLGGSCQLKGSQKWFRLGNKKISDVLPTEKVPNFKVEGLDLSGTVIQTNGISNFENCSNIKTLILNNCPYVDDWFTTKISHTFSDTLKVLELSNCQLITDNGLLPLAYLQKLENLKISNLSNAKNKEFISILLEENRPELQIEGTDHLSEEVFQKIEESLSNTEDNIKLK